MVLRQSLRVTQDNNTVLSSGQPDIQTSWISQETNVLFIVSSDTGKNDEILLTTLESIDGGNFNLVVQFLLHGPVHLHVLNNIGSLTLVRSNDTDLIRLDTVSKQSCNDTFTVHGFDTVKERSTTT
ncbi:hypothetical protein WICPIJ_009867 [Wickerhamomyces pijperi]|uniref:Uncharacterized protein n=1 Tax=Wickerhamomyces pijperi TaxID=599730 RepID=A0A9P8TBC2_WICPI|nr:hypothetical protein WICPIJ_009867 [Wickerhamomyces pijperi]